VGPAGATGATGATGSGATGAAGATGATGSAGAVYVKSATINMTGSGANLLCTATTDKSLGAGFAPTLTGVNNTTLALQPVDSSGNVITSGTPNGWKFTSSAAANTSIVVYITCVP
jgi:hypothetical protein